MTDRRLTYIANARLPTEKAHGYQIVKMCEAFAQNKINVHLLHSFRHQPTPLKSQTVFDYYGVPCTFEVLTLPNLDIMLFERFFPKIIFGGLFFIHAMLWGLYAALRVRNDAADLYYTREITVAYWLARFDLPTIFEAHAVPQQAHRMLLRQIASRPTLKLIVVLTSFIKERFVRMGIPENKIVVLGDSADLSQFANLPSKQECRRLLGLPQDRPIIGYIGRFLTLGVEKGIPELVQALADLPLINGEEPLLLCVGGPMDLVPSYLDLARFYGAPESRLRFVDRVPNREVPLWIRSFDIAVAPFPKSEHYSYYMSPLKLFEYMAGGVPILTTDLPSIREVLKHRETAWLVQPGNPADLAESIKHLINNSCLKNRLSSAACKAVSKHTWQQRASTILKQVGVPNESAIFPVAFD